MTCGTRCTIPTTGSGRQSRWARASSPQSGPALGGLVCALISLGSFVILGWWIRSLVAALGL